MLKLVMAGFKAGLGQPLLAAQKKRKLLVRPRFLDYAVTWRCNARCVMCDTWRAGPEPSCEITPEKWREILKRDAGFLGDVAKLGLTGGEPFLRDDLVELIRTLHRGLPRARISVVSNGLLTGRILKALEQIKDFLPELIFSVSLDGPDETHDRVRGIPGAFEKSLATIKGALEMGFCVTSGMTLSGLNFDRIGETARLLSSLGVDFSCNLMETGANFHHSGRDNGLDQDQTARVRESLKAFPHHYYMDQVRRSLDGKKRDLPCYSGMVSYFLHPNGDLNLCNLVSEPMGNILETPFARAADSPAAWELRRKYDKCTCWSQCEVKNSAAAAPWHVLKWMLANPERGKVIRHYLAKRRALPH